MWSILRKAMIRKVVNLGEKGPAMFGRNEGKKGVKGGKKKI